MTDYCNICHNLLDDMDNCGECYHPYVYHNGSDPVNNPSHYGQGSIECIDYIKDFLTEDEYTGYLRGNVAKYLHRWRYKNGIEDLKKARWYLEALIQQQSKK